MTTPNRTANIGYHSEIQSPWHNSGRLAGTRRLWQNIDSGVTRGASELKACGLDLLVRTVVDTVHAGRRGVGPVVVGAAQRSVKHTDLLSATGGEAAGGPLSE